MSRSDTCAGTAVFERPVPRALGSVVAPTPNQSPAQHPGPCSSSQDMRPQLFRARLTAVREGRGTGGETHATTLRCAEGGSARGRREGSDARLAPSPLSSLPPEEPIYCYTPHNFTRDQALYARGYCWTELRDALPGVDASLWPSLFEHKLLPYSLLAFAAIMYVPALGWEFLASTRLTSELNFLLQEIDNCYHRAAEGRAPKIEKQIQSKGPGITERERREIIENAEKEKSPEQNLFEKYLERRGRSNFLAKLYLARHLLILLLSVAPISYLCTYYATQKQNEFTCALGAAPGGGPAVRVTCKLPSVQLQRIVAGVDIVLLCSMNLTILVNLVHLFIFRKSNFIFDKLHKVGIKTRRQWRRSQFCDINILAMFCNENRDHIKSLNRLDFITNESDLMYDNVVRQLLAALAQSNHDATPTVRDAAVQTAAAFATGPLAIPERGWSPDRLPTPARAHSGALLRVETAPETRGARCLAVR
ncbi:Pannexin-2, partial [Eschrichtius robustus]|nr:Pannexin-2 [Eschrichtius robustus]